MAVVELTEVKVQFGALAALQGISLDIREGEILGLFGHNGAGKTTTIKLILGLLSPQQGRVQLFGHNPCGSQGQQLRQQLGFLQENVSFYEQLSGLEVLRFFARLKGVALSQCMPLLEQLGLAAAATRKVKTYSKGMRQRLGLAQALLGQPRLLLLDEPTVGLDPIATREFYQLLDQHRARGCAILLCSHVLPGVEHHLDRAAILGQGRLLALDKVEQLSRDCQLPLQLELEGQVQLPASLQPLSTERHDSGVRVTIAQQEKLSWLQACVGLPGLHNIRVQMPTLEDVYYALMAELHQQGEIR
ncbi:ABC transporter ATP-binding protein [Balneatrix alpica]|uniref:ABC transporter ATP-binding protein n=1 Tax=Balneatrix alpica TaxID=75684 RepID=A0ABV5ZES3_9GAMM|nr:ABC transporter ATP-binding protein [Balneatrix alpica]